MTIKPPETSDEYADRMNRKAALIDRVTSYAANSQHAQEIARQKRDDLIWAVRKSVKEGLSEYDAAAAAGVTRQTVRAWLGK